MLGKEAHDPVVVDPDGGKECGKTQQVSRTPVGSRLQEVVNDLKVAI